MLDYRQVIAMCVSAMVVCWGLALLWQADVTQSQCDSFLWVIVLPTSFLIHLNNIKAYRLSVIIRANFKRLKPFPHSKVLRLSLLWTSITVLFLFVIVITDPPRRVLTYSDDIRPSLNRYQCRSGLVSSTLLAILVVGHVIASVVCVVSVRNGMEAFRDGTLLKEAFVGLYSCFLVSFILQQLDLSLTSQYEMRTIFIGIGVTAFCVRLLINRCLRHWIPLFVQYRLSAFYEKYLKPVLYDKTLTHSRGLCSRVGSQPGRNGGQSQNMLIDRTGRKSSVGTDVESPVYTVEYPSENSISEMYAAISDPTRYKLLFAIAKGHGCSEGLEFIRSVLCHRIDADILRDHAAALPKDAAVAKASSENLLTQVDQIIKNQILIKSDTYLKLSSTTKGYIERCLKEWKDDIYVSSAEIAYAKISAQYNNRVSIVDPAFDDMSVLIFQMIWTHFRTTETEILAGQDVDYARDVEEIVSATESKRI